MKKSNCPGTLRHSRWSSARRLTPIVTIDRRVRLSLSHGRGHGVGFCSWLLPLGGGFIVCLYAAIGTKIFGFHLDVIVCVLIRANTIGFPSLPYLSSKSRFNIRTSGSSSGKSTNSNFSGRTSNIFGLFSAYLMISPVKRTLRSMTSSFTFGIVIPVTLPQTPRPRCFVSLPDFFDAF